MEINKQSVVTQSNKLVEAKFALTIQEQRLVLVMVSMISLEDKDFKDYIIHLGELSEFLGLKTQSMYVEAKKITRRLREREIIIQEPTGELQIGWISSAKYLESEGSVRLRFDPALKPYLLALKSQFTSFHLDIIIHFKSSYSIRIYQLLKQYESIGKRKFRVVDLREILGIQPDEYTRYNDFKRKVINPAFKEINSKSDISFKFEELKEGKRIVSLLFLIKRNSKGISTVEPTPLPPAHEELVALLTQYGITKKDALKVIAEQGAKVVREIFDKVMSDVDRRVNSKPILDVGAYLAKCLKEGYGKLTVEQREAKKKKEEQAVILKKQEENRLLLKAIQQEARERRKASTILLIESLTPEEMESYRAAYEQTPDFPGWNAPLVKRLFEIFLKNTFLGTEESFYREIAREKGVNDYDELVRSLEQ